MGTETGSLGGQGFLGKGKRWYQVDGGHGKRDYFCWLGLVVRVCGRGQLMQGPKGWINSAGSLLGSLGLGSRASLTDMGSADLVELWQ